MGVLEEAIRDHLELKRRHGASDEEVEQEEAEALGPARRGFEGPVDEAAEEEAAEAAADTPDQATQVHEQLPAEPEHEHEHELEFEPEPEPEPEGDTLLPEAPDFIEDTPEQDRVRSEKKPPQDFDFE